MRNRPSKTNIAFPLILAIFAFTVSMKCYGMLNLDGWLVWLIPILGIVGLLTLKLQMGFWNRFFIVGGVILLIPWAIVVILGLIVYSSLMVVLIRCVCVYRGRYIVFVHSNSPVWQDYIARNILPRLPPDTVILNWSDHLKWKWFSFPVRVFRLYGKDTEYNPIGLVATGLNGVRRFRFWQPFKDYKHGNEEPLKEMEKNFFDCIDKTKSRAKQKG